MKKFEIEYQMVTIRKAYVEAECEENARMLFNEGDIIDDFHDMNYAMNVECVIEIEKFPEYLREKDNHRRHG
jgi:hypothetical protein